MTVLKGTVEPTPETELEIVERLKVAKLEPGDVLVLEYPGILTIERANTIKHYVESVFEGHRCVVLQGGMTLKVASPVVANGVKE